MTTFTTIILSIHSAYGLLPTVRLQTVISITLWMTGFLCILNIALALFYRRRKRGEVFSYYAAFAIELAIFVFAFLALFNIVSAPFHLPPGLQFNQGEIGAALALGIGLFPAAYWHSINLSDLPKRLADDAKIVKNHDASVRVRSGTPGEWMN